MENKAKERDENLLIGRRIRNFRTIRGISLKQMSEDISMGYSYLSGLENGKHSITLNNLQKIANYFEVDLVSLISSDQQEEIYYGKESRPSIETKDGTIFQVITNENIKNLQVTFAKLPPHAPSERNIHKHIEGDELIYVVEGEVMVIVEDTKYHLKKGDSLIFSSSKEHAIFTENKSCEVMLVSSPPYKRHF